MKNQPGARQPSPSFSEGTHDRAQREIGPLLPDDLVDPSAVIMT
jgi:hypothetical protein